MYRTSLIVLAIAGAGACVDPSSGSGSSCEEAAARMDSCLPGMVSERPAVCDADAEAHAEWVMSRTCDEILTDAADGKADGIPALEGVKIRREGNLTYFSIPLARTGDSDRGYLLDAMVQQFSARMGQLNQQMIAHGLDLGGVLTGDTANAFLANYTSTINAVIGANTSENVAVALGETVQNPTKLSTWQRYVIPQAFVAYFSAKFSVNVGIGGGASATVMIVVQPWLTLAVDHTLAQPKVVSKTHDVDVAIIGVPNVDIGFGAGGGPSLRLGLGAVFGPLDQPNNVAGTGIGLSGSATAPVIGGLSGKFVTILKYPPLFLLMLGYSTGTAAELEIHGDLQQLLDLGAFLHWIDVTLH
jgi:hypothetical protein